MTKKHYFTLLTATLLSAGVMAQNGVEFSALSHNFGTIKEFGGDVKCEFVVKNSSKKAILLTKASSTCSCITVRHSRKPIQPNQCDTLKVIFDPRFRKGTLQRNITLQFAGETTTSTLSISGYVK